MDRLKLELLQGGEPIEPNFEAVETPVDHEVITAVYKVSNALKPSSLPYLDLDCLKQLPEREQAFYVVGDTPNSWRFRFRIIREFRDDGTQARHPVITASDGDQKIRLALSKLHGWHIQQHNGDIDFNRQILRYLNKGELSVGEEVFLTLGGSNHTSDDGADNTKGNG